MKAENTLAKHIETADSDKVSLDTACKKLLANKIILAWILKNCVEEYKDCTLKEIEEKYIEGIPEISQTAVHQDETASSSDSAENIEGSRNEDASMTEGTVAYDVKFNAIRPLHSIKLPNINENKSNYSKKTLNLNKQLLNKKSLNNQALNMIINVEDQTNFNPGYPLIKRGIYYGGRMISSQYGTVFTKSHYEKIRKVYSIWVCLNPPKYRKNSINMYSFKEKRLFGNVKEKRKNYDLITVVMICLGDEDDKDCNDLIRLLSVLLSTTKTADEKKTILESEFGIEMTKEMRKETSEMCDFSDYVEQKGIQKGMQKGRAEGETLNCTL